MVSVKEATGRRRETMRPSSLLSQSRRQHFTDVKLLTAAFVVSRMIYYAVGVRMFILHKQWQLLDRQQLKGHLFASLFYLHSQPPLYNLFTGVDLKLPRFWQLPFLSVSSALLGLVIVLSTFLLCLELRFSRSVAYVIAFAVLLSPSFIANENYYYDTIPTAAALIVGGLCLARYFRSGSLRWGLGYGSSLALVVLTNSTFQWPWMLVLLLPLAVRTHWDWRKVARVTLLPVVLVGGWQLKDAVMFHTYTTSSWTGMNLYRVAFHNVGLYQINRLVEQNQLSPVALHSPFVTPVATYVPKLVSAHPGTGEPVLDNRLKSNGQGINLNNANFIAISNAYLKDDLRYIELAPMHYLATALTGVRISLITPDQYFILPPVTSHISAYEHWFDRIVMLEPGDLSSQKADTINTTGTPPPWEDISYTQAFVFLLSLVGLPLLLIRRRRGASGSATYWLLAYVFANFVYVLVSTSLLDVGENNRFLFELGPLPLIGAVGVVASAMNAVRTTNSRGRGRHSRAGSKNPLHAATR
jgi:hypothetical protein